jgi:hypothetical protein
MFLKPSLGIPQCEQCQCARVLLHVLPLIFLWEFSTDCDSHNQKTWALSQKCLRAFTQCIRMELCTLRFLERAVEWRNVGPLRSGGFRARKYRLVTIVGACVRKLLCLDLQYYRSAKIASTIFFAHVSRSVRLHRYKQYSWLADVYIVW